MVGTAVREPSQSPNLGQTLEVVRPAAVSEAPDKRLEASTTTVVRSIDPEPNQLTEEGSTTKVRVAGVRLKLMPSTYDVRNVTRLIEMPSNTRVTEFGERLVEIFPGLSNLSLKPI